MQAPEAIQRVLKMARAHIDTAEPDIHTIGHEGELEEMKASVVLVEHMLAAAVPVARFRCFVEIDADQPRAKIPGIKASPVKANFIITAVSIDGIRGGLVGLSIAPLNIRATLWEQSKGKTDMVSGYQGKTKGRQYNGWLEQIGYFEAQKEGKDERQDETVLGQDGSGLADNQSPEPPVDGDSQPAPGVSQDQ